MRYNALLEGLEVSEIMRSKLDIIYDIIGSEFYSNIKLNVETKLSGEPLCTYFDLISDTISELNEEAYLYDLTESLGNFLKEGYLINKIDSNKKIAINGDVIISRLRSYLKEIAIVYESDKKQVFSTEYLIYRKKNKVSGELLLAFLLSNHVQTILNYSQYGSAHPRFYEFVLNNIKIPRSVIDINHKITDLINKTRINNIKSQNLYTQATELLEETLGLKNWQPSEENINVQRFSNSFAATGRIDAEYYQPFYDDVENILKSTFGYDLVENICSDINYGTVPTSPYTEDGTGIPYIKGTNFKNAVVDSEGLDRIILPEDFNEKFFTKEGDIIISQMGTVGDTGVVEKHQEGWTFASFTIRIRLKNLKEYNPYFVALYIQNIAKKYYLYRNIAQASVRQNTDLPTIKGMYIPRVPINIQNKISNFFTEARQLKQQSTQLLEQAKQAVEIAIEQGEETAMKFLEN